MNSYDFELIFKLPHSDEDLCQYSDLLFEHGCDDAIISSGQLGMLALSFTREASTAKEAIESAIKNVTAAIPAIELVEASPDFVSITDISTILGNSRQYTRKLFNEKKDLPNPVHIGNPSIWHLSEILHWIKSLSTKTNFNDSLLEVSAITRDINLHKQLNLH